MKRAIKIVNDFYNTDITTLSRKKEFRHPRQVYLYCMRNVMKKRISLENLGKSVNLTNHATVIHAVDAIENEIRFDRDLKKEVGYLINKLDFELNQNSANFIMSAKEKELIVVWLELKGVEIDLENELWLQEDANININLLIELLVNYRKDNYIKTINNDNGMKLDLLIINDDGKQSYQDFYVNEKEIHGGYLVSDKETDGTQCINIGLPSGLFSVKANKNITDYLFNNLV